MAGTIKGITIQLGADTTKLSSALNSANRAIKSTQSELKSVERALKFEPGNTALLADKMNLLKEKTDAAKQKVDALKQAQAQLDASGVDKNSKEYQDLQRQIDLAEAEVRQLEAQTREFGSVGAQQIAAVGEKLKGIGDGIASAGKSLTTHLTLPLVAAGTAGAAKFAEVDKTMQLTNATMKNSEEEAKLLSNAMKDAAANSTFGMNDAANAALNFARGGWGATQAANALAPAMNLAAGEGGDLDTVSAGLMATMNGFGAEADEASKYADVFANACNSSALDVDGLSGAMSVAAPIFAAAGYKVNDAALYMGVMANAGIEASVAANSLKTGMARLVEPSKEGAEWMDRLGISVTNTDGTMKDSITIQSQMHDAFAGLSESEQIAAASAIFGKNQMSNWLALINTAPGDVSELSEALSQEGTTAEMANAMMGGFGGSMEKLKSSVDVAATSLGEALAPTILKVAEAIQKAVDWFNSLSDEQKQTVAKIGLVVAAIGPLLVVGGKLITGIGTIMTLAPKLKAAFTAVKAALAAASGGATGLSGALAAISAPAVAAVAAIAAVVAIVTTLWKTNEDFRNTIKSIWGEVTKTFDDAKQKILGAINSLGFDFKSVSEAIKAAWIGLCSIFAPVFEGAFRMLTTALRGFMDIIAGIIQVACGVIKGDWKMAWQGIVDIAKGIFNTLTAPIQGILTAIGKFFNVKMSDIKTLVSNALEAVKQFFTSKLEAVRTTVTNILVAVATFFMGKLIYIKDTVSNTLEAVRNFFQTKLEAVRTTVTNILTAIGSFFLSKLTYIKDTVSNALEAVRSFFQSKLDAAKSIVDSALNSIKSFFTNAFSTIKSTVSGALDSVKSTVSGALNSVKSTADNILNGLKGVFTNTFNSIKSHVQGVVEWLKGCFNFEWKLPHIKLPHFKLSGEFNLAEGKVPSLSVDWYDKGGIFTHPSIIGVGEKRPEFVGALDDLRAIVREESGGGAMMQELVRLMTIMVEQGGRPITVNQEIYADSTSYAEQQRQAAREFRNIARALT